MSKKPRRSRLASLVVQAPYAWLIAFFLVPFLDRAEDQPVADRNRAAALPPVFDIAAGWHGIAGFFSGLSLDNYVFLGSDPLYILSYLKSLQIAALSTLLLLLIGYPIAYAMTRPSRRVQPILVLLVILPFWTSFLIRIYAWMNILQHDGPLNRLLLALDLVREPPVWLSTNTAVYIGIVYSYLPFMVLPLYATLEKLDESLLEAAADLGCPRWKSVLADNRAAVGARRDRRLAALLHSGRRRVRHSGSARRLAHGDDRAGHLDGIFRQQGLADCVRGRRRPGLSSGHADRDLPAPDRCGAPRRTRRCANSPHSISSRCASALPFSICRSSFLSSIRSTLRVWSWCGAAGRRNGTVELAGDAPLLAAAFISIRVGLDGGNRGNGAGDARRGGAGAVRPLSRPAAVRVHDLRAAGDAGGYHRAVHAAPVRRYFGRTRFLDGGDRPHHHGHVLRRGDRAVAACRFRHEPRGSRHGSRRLAGAHVHDGDAAADPARRRRQPGCWPLRSRSTIWSSPASRRGRGRPRCRSASIRKSVSASARR